MLILKIVGALVIAVLALLGLVIAWGLVFGLPGRVPINLGVHAGRLAPSKTTPNCVSSDSTDAEHAIAPLPLGADAAAAMARLRSVLEAMPRVRIVSADGNYLYATQTSAALGFVDDVEFLADPAAGVIRVRSASRLGRKDFGVNRARIEAIRAAL